MMVGNVVQPCAQAISTVAPKYPQIEANQGLISICALALALLVALAGAGNAWNEERNRKVAEEKARVARQLSEDQIRLKDLQAYENLTIKLIREAMNLFDQERRALLGSSDMSVLWQRPSELDIMIRSIGQSLVFLLPTAPKHPDVVVVTTKAAGLIQRFADDKSKRSRSVVAAQLTGLSSDLNAKVDELSKAVAALSAPLLTPIVSRP